MRPKTRHQREELTITMSLNYGGGKMVNVMEMIRQADDGNSNEQKVVTVTGFKEEPGKAIKRNVDLIPLGASIQEIEYAVAEALKGFTDFPEPQEARR